ncbi:hypothetical protein AB833_01510 [Chromatiales bacterium (ex Bugula neritina AB1)]|nr:hypothetical protein AB833_01510 [Chromatiales bacterium (ex Bugula neritina AB1)]
MSNRHGVTIHTAKFVRSTLLAIGTGLLAVALCLQLIGSVQAQNIYAYEYPDPELYEQAEVAQLQLAAAIADLQDVKDQNNGIESDAQMYGFSWLLFELLMAELGDNRFFESMRPINSIYLPNGERPPKQAPIDLPEPVLAYAARYNIPSSVIWHDLDTVVKVSGLALKDKWNQNVRYALRMNVDMFDYILANGLFRANGLLTAGQIKFPDTSMELKTSWIWINNGAQYNELRDKYYIAYAYYKAEDGSYRVGRAALSGIHIVPKIQPGWVWITFENIHNATFTEASYELPINIELSLINDAEQLALADLGSVLANYQLNGVQTQEVQNGKPVVLANSQIESFFQQHSSCKTCHAIAAYKSTPRLQFHNIVNRTGNGTSYYTGTPPPISDWKSMDFSWSLKRAQWHRP